MKILNEALNKIKCINKKQKDFFEKLIEVLIGSAGKKTFRNLSRYVNMEEHTFGRQMVKVFDFMGLNTELIKATKNKDDVLIAAQDSSFIKKSGKLTHGLDFFWNGCAGKSEKGLEIDTIAAVKVNEKNDGYTISVKQTPANPLSKNERKKQKKEGFSRVDFYLDHIKKSAAKLFELGIKYVAVDAFYAKKKYVDGVVKLGLHVVSKLRKDARFKRPYTGPQKSRGRRKKYETGSIHNEDFFKTPAIVIKNKNTELYELIVYSLSLHCLIKVVLVKKNMGNNKYGEALLFSTDLELDALKIYDYYVARFQIEFIFRDAKGFTGLQDCQSRSAQRMHYHFNASLTALNFAKIQALQVQKERSVSSPFSMASWARKFHVGIVLNQFISMFELDQTLVKLNPNFEKILSFGSINY